MKKNTIFKGTATALITPFKNGEIDYSALHSIINFQLSSDIDALVIAGTTGEASVLSDAERYSLYESASRLAHGKVPLIFGVGTNDTRETAAHSKAASELGADALLVVTPYYNKGTEDGIYKHYISIAESTDLPIILYNVPSRTGVDLSLEMLSRLAECENIVAIKEASSSLDRAIGLSMLSEKLAVYSGNDSQIYTNSALGGSGVISVVSNILPKETKKITSSFCNGDTKAAFLEQKRLLPLINSLFAETSPAPIKYAMSLFGLCRDEMRLPMTPPKNATKERVRSELYALGITK